MRDTKKSRGGFKTNEEGKFARYDTEIDRLRRALRDLQNAVTSEEKVAAFKQWLEFVLLSNVSIRARNMRRTITQKIREARAIPLYAPLIPLMDEVVTYMNSIPSYQITAGKRKTIKNGGFESDPAGRFIHRDSEIRELSALARAMPDGMPLDEKKPLAKRFFELMLHSNYAIRNRLVRSLLQAKIDEARRLFPDLNDLVTEVQMYKDSIPASQIAGVKRKTKKTRKLRRHRK